MIDELIAHISGSVPSLINVDHAFTMEAVDELNEQAPAAFLYPGDESGEPSVFDNVTKQRLTLQIIVVLICPIAELTSLKKTLRNKVLGWQFDDDHDPLEFLNAKPVDIKSNHIWWRETYVTRTHIRPT